ncbi:uncharacterized protein EI90DRAFT_3015368 [Cantharellus anzutake]|uniref:uncharacterized protein n=1 Tax=Cantharellus anzutake TaxID=1750568 RepID=UPI001904F475|nr:uncharacterized protein EI90DRAFT_3015368 [Cantharellus anzutake]KAF8333481.1 hypothetical protein EI90DRAFT_3015368 [Cantharellus anzutake]
MQRRFGIFVSLKDTEREVDLQKREIKLLKHELEEAHALADLAAKPIMMGASQVRGRGCGSGPHEVRPHMGTNAPRGGAPTIPPPHGQATLSRLHKGPPSGGQTHVEGRWEDDGQSQQILGPTQAESKLSPPVIVDNTSQLRKELDETESLMKGKQESETSSSLRPSK